MAKLRWERVAQEGEVRFDLVRARIPQGWLVAGSDGALAFVPDAGGQWDFDELSEEKVQQSLVEIEDKLGELKPATGDLTDSTAVARSDSLTG